MTRDRTRLYGGIAAVALLAGAAGFGLARLGAPPPSAEAHEEGEAGHEGHADLVAMTPQAIIAAGVEVRPATAGGFAAEVLAQASVVAAPGGQAVLTAPAAGVVVRVLKRLGDPVQAGETLAVVESREAAQIAADRTVALAKATLAHRTLARERSLFEQRVSPRVDYEQAQAEAAAADAEASRAQAAARATHVTSDGRLAVSSPIAGRVAVAAASLGAFVQPETELFRIADPRLVQVEAAVSGLDAGRIAPGDRAVLEIADGPAVEGRVRSVTPGLDPESRAATALLDLPGATLRPGQAGRARIFPRASAPSSAIVVPDEAVQTLEGREVVFVRAGQGFRATPVRVGRRSAGRAEIVSGLVPGQMVAVRNAFLLKAELGKGEDHGH